MTWLLTGGAGYIGAHVVRALRASGQRCVVLDDLSTGRRATLPDEVPLVRADVRDRIQVERALVEHEAVGVIHLAAKKSPTESVADPMKYYRENIGGMESLLSAMRGTGVRRLVLSSSCSVYGMPDQEQVDENTPLHPLSPYGESKLACEWLSRAAAAAHGFDIIALRYFNVAGAQSRELGDTGTYNLIPLSLRAVLNGEPPTVFGTDYPTPDGSCIRDYVHVGDLAEAHRVAALHLVDTPPGGGRYRVYNVGRGAGHSVFEVLDTIRRVTESSAVPVLGPRRPGDPARVVASTQRITSELGWTARFDLDAMVSSAWEARTAMDTPQHASTAVAQ